MCLYYLQYSRSQQGQYSGERQQENAQNNKELIKDKESSNKKTR